MISHKQNNDSRKEIKFEGINNGIYLLKVIEVANYHIKKFIVEKNLKNIINMRNSNFIFAILFLFSTILSSCKKESNQQVKVVRDCTGTYLHWEGKDYKVCNLEKVSPFPDGTTITATFTKTNNCNGSAKNAIVCFMLHDNEGWIEVNNIK